MKKRLSGGVFLLSLFFIFSACSWKDYDSKIRADKPTTIQTDDTYSRTKKTDKKREDPTGMDGKMTVNGTIYRFVLNDSQAAKDFAAMMSMTLDLKDYAGTEKVARKS